MSSFGKIFKVTTFGESHCFGVGCIIENVPPFLPLEEKDIQYQLDKRKPNQNSILSNRNEPDTVQIVSGTENGHTLGTPLMLLVKNVDIKPSDYKSFSNIPRPGHADLTYLTKYGVKASSGSGRASARETVARVAAGAVAEKYLKLKYNCHFVSWVSSIGNIEMPKEKSDEIIKNGYTKEDIDELSLYVVFKSDNDIMILHNKIIDRYFMRTQIEFEEINKDEIKINDKQSFHYGSYLFRYTEMINVRCPDYKTAIKMIFLILKIKSENDSIGGCIIGVIKNCPQSLGEPCFDKFEAELAKAMLSIPATKGFEIGSGFEGTKLK